jgi:ActR/RegA family two-component response regulator
MGALQARLRR